VSTVSGEEAKRIIERERRRGERDERERVGSPSAMQAAAQRVQALNSRSGLRRFLFENALSLVAVTFFLVSLTGLVFAGRSQFNDDQRDHGKPAVGVRQYVTTGHFMEALGENWESAFLEMGIFVILTRFLYQRGSSESKRIEGPETTDQDPREAKPSEEAPWPVRRGGVWLKVYENSLSIVLLTLFVASFSLHAVGGAMKYNDNQRDHGSPVVSTIGYIGTNQFWFESFQNWQSEFLSVATLALLTIWLRQRGSPQSKPVAASMDDTGE
jgi:hypothetical protein